MQRKKIGKRGNGISARIRGARIRGARMGGAAIAEGGYGCVFSPAIGCHEFPVYAGNRMYVSKLMRNEDADIEMHESKKVTNIVSRAGLPEKYFGVPEKKCAYLPGSIGRDETAEFTDPVSGIVKPSKKCMAIYRAVLEPGGFSLLQSRYGGPDMYSLWDGVALGKVDMSVIARVTAAMLKMLVTAIVPMNKAGLWHCDLKSENVLSRRDGSDVMMIDWGLMRTHKTKQNYPWTLQWNNPLASLFIGGLKREGKPTMIPFEIVKTFIEIPQLPSNTPFYQVHAHYAIVTLGYALLASGEKVSVESIFRVVERYYKELLSIYERIVASLGIEAAIKVLEDMYFKNIDLWGFVCCFAPLIRFSNISIAAPAARAYLYIFSPEAAGPNGISAAIIHNLLKEYIPLTVISANAPKPVYISTRQAYNNVAAGNYGEVIIKQRKHTAKNKKTRGKIR